MFRYTWKTSEGRRIFASLAQLKTRQVEELLEILGKPGETDLNNLMDRSIVELVQRAVGSQRVRRATAALLEGVTEEECADMPLEVFAQIWFEDFFLCYPRTAGILRIFAGSIGFPIAPLNHRKWRILQRRVSSCFVWLAAIWHRRRRSGR